MTQFAKSRLRKISNSLLYGVVFVFVGYLSSLIPTLATRLYSQTAPNSTSVFADVPPPPTDSGDVVSDSDVPIVTGDSGGGDSGSDSSGDADCDGSGGSDSSGCGET